MLKILLFLVAATAALGDQCVGVSELEYGTLEILATTRDGTPVPGVEVRLEPLTGDHVPTDSRSTRIRVLYGDYRVAIHSAGSYTATRVVRIYQPEVSLRVELDYTPVCMRRLGQIGGRIDHAEDAGDLWVKAVPLRGMGGAEARVSEQGYFLIGGLEQNSEYLVLVMKDRRLLHNELVKADPSGSGSGSKLTIDLRTGR
jgi:hypothetical protein